METARISSSHCNVIPSSRNRSTACYIEVPQQMYFGLSVPELKVEAPVSAELGSTVAPLGLGSRR